MKKLALLISILASNCFATDNDLTIGLGLGYMYSGVGANIGLVSKTDMKYASAGCVSYQSSKGSTCGFGVGWIKTDLFDAATNKHGLGLYLSIVGNESGIVYENNRFKLVDEDVYGVGVSYTYFLNGIDQSGLNLGVGAHAHNAEYQSENVGIFLQAGYQF